MARRNRPLAAVAVTPVSLSRMSSSDPKAPRPRTRRVQSGSWRSGPGGRRAMSAGQEHLQGAGPGERAVGEQAEVAGQLVDHDPGGVGRALLEALGEAAGVADRPAEAGPEGHGHGGGHGQPGQEDDPAGPGAAGGEHDQGRGRGQHGGEGAADVGPEPRQPVDHAQGGQQGRGRDRGQGRERGDQHDRGQGEGEVAVAEAVEALAVPGAAADQRLGQPVAAEDQVEHDQDEQRGPEQRRGRHPAPAAGGVAVRGPVEPEGDGGQGGGRGDPERDPGDRPGGRGARVAQGRGGPPARAGPPAARPCWPPGSRRQGQGEGQQHPGRRRRGRARPRPRQVASRANRASTAARHSSGIAQVRAATRAATRRSSRVIGGVGRRRRRPG